MIYDYFCPKCEKNKEITKSMHESKRIEYCVQCNSLLDRVYSSKIHFKGAKSNDAEYNPAFGKIIKNKRERQYEAEKRGWVEVGNDYKSGESMQKDFDAKRKQKNNKIWEEA